MRNFFLLFVLFICNPVNAQKYTFNTLAKYSSSFENIKNEGVTYTNAEDDSYFLRIRKDKSSVTASLFDYKNLKLHTFIVWETKVNGEIVFHYDYQSTSNINYFNKKDYSKYVFVFETLASNDSINKVNLKVYGSSKKKNPLRNYDLQIKNHEKNLFPVFRIHCMHPYEFLESLNIFKTGVVLNAQGNTSSGKLIEFKLEELKDVNFRITIPKQKKEIY